MYVRRDVIYLNLILFVLDSNNSKQKYYFVFKSDENELGILEETLFLLFSSILYIVIILLFDYKIFARIYMFGFNKIVGTGVSYKSDNEDPDVSRERDKVNADKIRPRISIICLFC